MTPIEDAIADIQIGFTRTLALICNHLIDQQLLNKELFIADLSAVHAALVRRNVGSIGLSVPSALATALRQSAEDQP